MDDLTKQLQEIRNEIANLQQMAGSLATQESQNAAHLASLQQKSGTFHQFETGERRMAALFNQMNETCQLMNQHLDNISSTVGAAAPNATGLGGTMNNSNLNDGSLNTAAQNNTAPVDTYESTAPNPGNHHGENAPDLRNLPEYEKYPYNRSTT